MCIFEVDRREEKEDSGGGKKALVRVRKMLWLSQRIKEEEAE